MRDQFPPGQNSAKDDFVVPEAGPGEEAAGFNAKAQQENFLGGGGGPEMKPRPQTVEQKTYLPDQKLTEMEKRTEGQNLIRGFVSIFSKDPDVQRKIVEAYFRYEDSQGRPDYPSGDIFFKRGTGEYWLRTTDGDINRGQMFRLQRKEGNATELIEVKVGRPEEHSSSINYSASYDSALDISLKYVIGQHRHEGKQQREKTMALQ